MISTLAWIVSGFLVAFFIFLSVSAGVFIVADVVDHIRNRRRRGV